MLQLFKIDIWRGGSIIYTITKGKIKFPFLAISFFYQPQILIPPKADKIYQVATKEHEKGTKKKAVGFKFKEHYKIK